MIRPYLQLVFALIILSAALAAYGAWYYALSSASAAVVELSQEVAAKNANAAEAVTASEALSQLSGAETEIDSYFVVPDDVVTFLENLQSTGTSLGSTVTVVSVSANPDPRPHLDLALKIDGPFDAVMKTAGALEYAPYDITVDTLSLDSDGTDNWTAEMALTVGTASSTATTATTTTP